MRKFLSIPFLFLSSLHAETIRTKEISIIQDHLNKADKKTLIIFDVDDVLMHPLDLILQSSNRDYLKKIQKDLEKRISKDQAQKLYSTIFIQRHITPVDKSMVSLISNLQNKDFKVLALTNCFTGKFGFIDSMEDWRINELTKMGYHFKKSWKNISPSSFNIFLKEKKDFYLKNSSLPMFKKGVIFTSNTSKGVALKAFLKYVRFLPSKIIFIDDKKTHLKSVEDIADEMKIPFVGIQYTEIKERPFIPLNKERVLIQFQTLEKKNLWLSDIDVDLQLKSTKTPPFNPTL